MPAVDSAPADPLAEELMNQTAGPAGGPVITECLIWPCHNDTVPTARDSNLKCSTAPGASEVVRASICNRSLSD